MLNIAHNRFRAGRYSKPLKNVPADLTKVLLTTPV